MYHFVKTEIDNNDKIVESFIFCFFFFCYLSVMFFLNEVSEVRSEFRNEGGEKKRDKTKTEESENKSLRTFYEE